MSIARLRVRSILSGSNSPAPIDRRLTISVTHVRAVLWDADGVLQHTPADAWDLAVRVVTQIPGANTGAAIDEEQIRTVADDLGLGDQVNDILAVWTSLHLLSPSLRVVAGVRATGTACYLATNQDAYRATCMRHQARYGELLDGAYYSCDIGAAKPSAAFFEHITLDLDLAPDQLLFLDDQPENVTGARSVGLRAECWTHVDGIPNLIDLLDSHGIRLTDDSG